MGDGVTRCWFCGCDVVGEYPVCSGSGKCRALDERLREELDQKHQWDRAMAAWHVLLQWGRHSPEIRWGGLTIWRRAFYTFKAIVCIWLELEEHLAGQIKIPKLYAMAIWDVGPAGGEYSGESWMELAVGRGVLRNWCVEIFNNTSV